MDFSKSEIKQLCMICGDPKYNVDSVEFDGREIVGVCPGCRERYELNLELETYEGLYYLSENVAASKKGSWRKV
jgi:uncharacterized CHY-type Zn-finger protein